MISLSLYIYTFINLLTCLFIHSLFSFILFVLFMFTHKKNLK